MTLAEFYALQASPQAIVLPRGGIRKRLRSTESTIAAVDANSTVTAVLPDEGGADKKH